MLRDDVNIIGLPLTRICNEQYHDPRQRQLFKNVIYVGALAALLDMDFKVLTGLVADQFKGKEKLVLPNIHALELGHQYAKTNLDCPIGIRVEDGGQGRGQNSAGWQHRPGPGRNLRRCYRRGLVPDYAFYLGGGCV